MLNQIQEQEFLRLRREWIAQHFSALNDRQLEGVMATEGPLLLLAGAGSGKTTVLIRRIANLLKYGRGSDSDDIPNSIMAEDIAFLASCVADGPSCEEDEFRADALCRLEAVRPWQVIAITFTNKAAGELKERLEAEIGPEANDVWAATFHSACVRILRRDIDRLGFPSSFTIYDTDDSIRTIKECLRELNFDEKSFPPREILSRISNAKDAMQLADEFMKENGNGTDFRLHRIAMVYQLYERKLWNAGALDFDDIILHTVRLLQKFEEVREFYRRKFRYVLIDEYQDTNHLQYLLAGLLTGERENICVVGDDDQSIYRFRGATIENILSFESEFKNARVIRLEQNYRSTGNILNASNAVIRNNRGRKGKKLWTEHEDGEKVHIYAAMNERDEGSYIVGQILKALDKGLSWKDCAVLYRMNALSNQLEIALKGNSIPYRVVGGFRFFERAEIKDMLSYLSLLRNPADDLRLLRVINMPPRGIGNKTMETVREISALENKSLWEILSHAEDYPVLQRSAAKLMKFVSLISSLRDRAAELPLSALYEKLMDESGYTAMLLAKKDADNQSRMENIRELLSSITGYMERAEEPTLDGFLDEVALYTDLDAVEDSDNCVTLMTMHAAKGLEFPVVFVAGMEEGVFPGFRSVGDDESLEEERRLCYVAMTRAKQSLHLTHASQRMLYGRTSANLPSRFVREVPGEFAEQSGRRAPRRESSFGFESGGWERSVPHGSYSSATRPAQTKPAAPKRPAPPAGPTIPNLHRGETIHHTAFGTGMVISVQPMGGDALIEVAFDTVGTKRLMLKSAAQYITKES